MTTISVVWDNLLEKLKDIFANNVFESYIKPAKPISFYNEELVIAVTQSIQPQWERYIKNSALSVLSEHYPNIKITIQMDIPELHSVDTYVPTQNQQSLGLKQSFTFDNFIVGKGNQMAHAAALAVSDSPGNFYNPLFIYGGSGLGKTHLMHAIGNTILKNRPNAVIRYVTSEDFVNEFTNAIRHGAMEEFKNNYRQVDLLLVDDIQFLAGKEQTLDEFFHTFNALHSAGKQIVLTSDRLASEIPELPARLVSRFSSGLSTDITPPDLETRTAILREKAISNNINIPNDTLNYIAGHVNSNVRDLEGALTRVNFYSITYRKEITTSLAAEALQSLNSIYTEKVLTIYDIQNEVSRIFNVSIDQLKGRQKSKEIVIPRQIAMYLSRELTEQSLPSIGKEFGNKDHTTVMHAVAKISNLLQENADLQIIQQIKVIQTNLM